MKPRERFITALTMGIPDRVPLFEFLFSPRLQEKIIGYRTELYDGDAIVKLATKLGIDGVPIPLGGYCGFEDFPSKGDTYTDEWGIDYRKIGWPVMVQTSFPIKNRKDWERYSMPDPKATHRTDKIKAAISVNNGELAIVAGLLGPVTMMYWYFMDITTLSYTFIEDPNLILEICDTFADWAIEAAGEVKKIDGVDAFFIADDWGASNSLLISPEYLKKYFFKSFGKMVSGIKDLGYPVIMHNDGNLWEVMDELVATGINGYHPIERAATMDLKTIKERYRGKLCPIGNVNNKTVMVSGTPEEVAAETIECLKIGGPGGGYIIATDHSLHDDIPDENIWTYLNTVKKYGKYPLNFND
jgi:uroporphyrinogen decarboxylase